MNFFNYLWPQGWLSFSLVITIASIFVILAIFQAAAFYIGKSKQVSPDLENFQKRIKTWWFILAPLAATLLLGPYTFCLLWSVLAAVAVYEITLAHDLSEQDRPLKYYLYVTPFIYTLAVFANIDLLSSLALILLIPSAYMLTCTNTESFLQRSAFIHWIIIQVVFLLGFIPLLTIRAPGHDPQVGKAAIIIWVLFIAQFNDAMQYCCGKSFGRTAIIPKVSPKKTWEGFLGGALLCSAIGAFTGPWLTLLGSFESLVVAFLICISGFWGDVALSAVKRGLGIKDFSQLLSGHGGLLDRVDSLIYAAPAAFVALKFFT